MFQQIGDWYGATGLKGDDVRLQARRAAGETLISGWAKASLPDLVSFVAYGLAALGDLPTEQDSVGNAVCEAIVNAQPSFDVESEANTLDPRLCVLVALGEFLARRLSRSATWKRVEREVVVAEALVTSLRYRDLTSGAFLNQRVIKLYGIAVALLDKMDESRRQRRGDPTLGFASLKTQTDLAAIRDALISSIQTLTHDVLLDREEVQALWWVFGGYSTTQKVAFARLEPAAAALVSGAELANMVRWPGTTAMGALAARLVPDGGTFAIEALSPGVAKSIVENDDVAMVRAFPSVFPLLSAAADRIQEKAATVSLRTALEPAEVAQQSFSEFSLLGALR